MISETVSRALWWVGSIVASVCFFWFTAGMQIHAFAIAVMSSVISLAVLLGAFEGVWRLATKALGIEG